MSEADATPDPPSDEDRRRETVRRGVRWSFATTQQCIALGELDGEVVLQSGMARAGRQSVDAPAYRLAFERHAIAVHLLMVCAFNMIRAIDKLGDDPRGRLIPVSEEMRSWIKLLRDYSEHWDEHGVFAQPVKPGSWSGSAGRKLAERFPDEDPDRYTWTDGLFGRVGGLHVIHVRWLAQYWESEFLQLEQSSFIWDGWPAEYQADAAEPEQDAP